MYMLGSKLSSAVPSDLQTCIKNLSFPCDHHVTE